MSSLRGFILGSLLLFLKAWFVHRFPSELLCFFRQSAKPQFRIQECISSPTTSPWWQSCQECSECCCCLTLNPIPARPSPSLADTFCCLLMLQPLHFGVTSVLSPTPTLPLWRCASPSLELPLPLLPSHCFKILVVFCLGFVFLRFHFHLGYDHLLRCFAVTGNLTSN